MASAAHETGPRTRRPFGRSFVVGFLVGFLITVPVAVAALLSTAVERIAPVLTPGTALLRPLSGQMAGWPGAVNLLLGSVANGLVVGLLAVLVVALVRAVRRGR